MEATRIAVLVAATAVIAAVAGVVARAEMQGASLSRVRSIVEVGLPVAGLAALLVAVWSAAI